MDSVLRPREIQARIRAGATPETVAAAAGTTVDKIMGFAAPALAERAYIAQEALKASVRRRVGNGPAGRLGEAVAERLAVDQIDLDAVEWDAWRREDGRWTLRADLPGSGTAVFIYDAAGRYVVAEDEESRRLVGERLPTSATPLVQEVQLPLGDDAIELVTGRPAARPVARQPSPSAVPDAEEATVDLTEAASGATALGVVRAQAPRSVPRATRGRGRAQVPSWDEIMFGSSRGE